MRLALLLCLALQAGFAQPAPEETLRHFTALLKLDTRNPPGNETRAVEYLRGILEREGIPVEIFAQDPNRANLVARLKGNGSKRPLLIMGHTDVVGVQPEKWTVDPFAAVRKDGYIYGRGTTDDKDNLVACLMVMLALKRQNVPLDRDVIFLAESGEESTTAVGIDYMVKEHWPAIEAEFALAEGWGGISRKGKPLYLQVATTEKVPRPVQLRATGSSGHGSMPRPDNAIVRLSQALAKVGAWQPPMRLNATTQAYFERLANVSTPENAQRYRDISNPGKASAADQYFRTNELEHYSILRTSVSPTIVKAGFRHNVIPSEAEATLDVRALPDEDMPKFYAELKRVIGDETVQVVPDPPGRPSATESKLDTEAFRALERVQRTMYPGALTIPSMMTGATDMAQLRAKGVQAYGIGPMSEEGEAAIHGAHSDDERIAEASLHDFVRFLWSTVLEIAGSKP